MVSRIDGTAPVRQARCVLREGVLRGWPGESTCVLRWDDDSFHRPVPNTLCGKNMHHYPTIRKQNVRSCWPAVCVACGVNLPRNLGRGWRFHRLRLDKQQEQERLYFSCRAAQLSPACRPRGTTTFLSSGWLVGSCWVSSVLPQRWCRGGC